MAEEKDAFFGRNATTCKGLLECTRILIGSQQILEAAKGIRYIHSENMVHGDIRGVSLSCLDVKRMPLTCFSVFQDNVLLDGNFRVKIADFGLARHNDATATQSWALSYNFAAPELFGDCDSDGISSESDRDVQLMKKTFKTDVYAFACLYYEVAIESAVTRWGY